MAKKIETEEINIIINIMELALDFVRNFVEKGLPINKTIINTPCT
jgi:hypothetical protein